MSGRTRAYVSASMMALIIALSPAAGCDDTPAVYKDFLSLPVEEQNARVKKFPIDKQIEYHLARLRYTRPPSGFDDIIASEGKEAVPHLLKRLREEKLDYQRVNILYLLRYMHRFYYDLHDEPSVIEQLKDAASKIESPDHRKNAQEIVRDIEENHPPDIEKFKKKARPQTP